MFRLLTLFCALGLFLTGCYDDSNQEFTRFYEDGRSKPSVVLATIVDTTSFDYPWSLSEEFHSLLRSSFSSKGTLYIKEDNSSYLTSTKNPFGDDLDWIKQEYAPNEFVVFMEFIQHDQIPAKVVQDPLENVSTNLNLALRLRIVDIRGDHPKVILQQVIKDSFYTPKNFLPVDYNDTVWGTEEYTQSPLGTAHLKFCQTLVERLNDYILLAK